MSIVTIASLLEFFPFREFSEEVEATAIDEIPGVVVQCDVSNSGTVTRGAGLITEVDDQIGVNDALDSTSAGRWPTDETSSLNGLDAAGFHASPNHNIIQHDTSSGEMDDIFATGGFWAGAVEIFAASGTFSSMFSGFGGTLIAGRATDVAGRPLYFKVRFTGVDASWQTAANSFENDTPSIILIEYDGSDIANDPTITINDTEYTIGSGLTQLTNPTGTIEFHNVRAWGGIVSIFQGLIGEEIQGNKPLSAFNKDFLLTHLRDQWLP